MAGWLEWQDAEGYDGAWAWSTAQLFVPRHQWTFKITRNDYGKIVLQVYDAQEPLFERPIKYTSVDEAKRAAEKLVDEWRAQALAAGYAWSFEDFPGYQSKYRGGKARKRRQTTSRAAGLIAAAKALKQAWR